MKSGETKALAGIAPAKAIGRRIVTGKLRPGSLLPSTEQLAKEFAVSRLAIRENMKLLAGKGLIEAKPRRGTVVRPRSDWSKLDPDVLVWQVLDPPNAPIIRSLFEARRIIEPEAAALVAQRATQDVVALIDAAFQKMADTDPDTLASIMADVEFHNAILTGTENEFIAAFAPAIAALLPVIFRVQRKVSMGLDHFVPSHGAILDAIKRGDPEGARAAAIAQLKEAEIDALEGIRKGGADDG
jgi:GntR family transcriptional regulator, galactonate operon transcriptional repressor